MPNRIVQKVFRYRLAPTPEQERTFRFLAGCRRWLWNYALERKREHYRQTGKRLSYYALAQELTALKCQPETAWLAQADSQALQQVLQDLERAFTHFFAKRAGYPKRKRRHKTPHAFRIPQRVKVCGSQVSLPKVGLVHLTLHRPLEGEVKSATIKQEPTGHWYICFVAHMEMPDLEPTSCQNPVGIDFGLSDSVVCSDGKKVKAPHFYRKQERKLRRKQRRVSRRFDKHKTKARQPQSKNYQKARQQLACLHARIRQQRLDFLHKLTTRLVTEHDLLVIEDLDVSALTKTKLKGHAKSWADAASSIFRRLLAYKCEWYDERLIVVDRWFPSSKRCSACHSVYQVLKLSERTWQCPSCGCEHNRDENAACNLLAEGLALLEQESGGLPALMAVEAASDFQKEAAACEAATSGT